MSALPDLPEGLKNTLLHIANRFLDDKSTSLPHWNQVEELCCLLEDFRQYLPKTDSWTWWEEAKRWFRSLRHGFEAQKHASARFTPDEYMFLAALMLHIEAGFPVLAVTWPALERLSSIEIDEEVQLRHAGCSISSGAFWIELLGKPSDHVPAWMKKTQGLMVVKNPACAAPPEWHQRMHKHYRQGRRTVVPDDRTDAICQARAQNFTCDMYDLHIVRERGNDKEITHVLIADEADSPAVGALQLLAQVISADDRRKETRLVWGNIFLRLMLMVAAHERSHGNRPKVITMEKIPLTAGQAGRFCICHQKVGVQLHKANSDTVAVPFRIERP